MVGTRVVGAYYLAERKFAYRLCRAKHIQPLQQNNNNCISIFLLLFQKIRKATEEEKNRENRGKKNIFSIECVLTQDNLFEEPTSII